MTIMFRDGPKKGEIEETVMGRTVFPDETCLVQGEDDGRFCRQTS